MRPPGRYHAPGDAPGTTRYWDGLGWIGDAMRPEQTGSDLAYDRVPIEDAVAAQAVGADKTPTGGAKSALSSPSVRVGSIGLLTLGFGILLGIAFYNVVTLYPEPVSTIAEVVDVRESSGARRGRNRHLKIELRSPDGTFYAVRDLRTVPVPRVSRGDKVQVEYSAITGGLVAIPGYDLDRRPLGKLLWPAVGLAAIVCGGATWRADQAKHGGALPWLFFLVLVVIGPMLGFALVAGILDEINTALYYAP